MRYARLYQKLYCEPLMLSMDAFLAFDRVFQAAMTAPAVRPVDRAAADAPSGEYLDMYRRSRATMEQFRVEEVLLKYGPVAVVQVHGAIDRNLSRMEVECYGACDIQDTNAAIAECAADDSIQTVIFDFDTPGGGVVGLAETFTGIQRLGQSRNTVAWVGGQCCSAGVYLAVACHQIIIAEGAFMGSIGVRCARLDMTAAMKTQGVSVTLIATSDEKTDFSPAKPMSPEELARIQARVDSLYVDFCARVRAGRPGVSEEYFKAQVFYGAEAVAVGLADAVMPSLDDLATELLAATSSPYATNPGGGGVEYDAGKVPRAEREGTFGALAASPFRAESGNGGGNPNHDEHGRFAHSGTFDLTSLSATDRAAAHHGLLQTDKVHGVNGALQRMKTKLRPGTRRGDGPDRLKPHASGKYRSGDRLDPNTNGIYIDPGHASLALTAVHEAGHRVDHVAFGYQGRDWKKGDLHASENGTIPKLMEAIGTGAASAALNRRVKEYRGQKGAIAEHYRYLDEPTERFARAYTQYVATRSGDPELAKHLDSERSEPLYGKVMYHSPEEFKKVAAAFDKHFTEHGLK